jgi:hypothetical protein
MLNCTLRRAVTMLAMLAAPAVIFVAPLPASANSGAPLCETSGSYCVSTDNLKEPAPIVERSESVARFLIAVRQSGTFQGHAQYKLEFSANHGLCVAGDVFEQVVVYNCSATGSVWAQDGARWINVAETQSFGGRYDVYIAYLNRNGFSFQFEYLGQPGFYYSFAWS